MNFKFHHVSMDVKNYDACINFYTGLGLKIFCNWVWDKDVEEYKLGQRNCFLALNGNPIIELHEVEETKKQQGIIGHMCFLADTDEELELLYNRAILFGAKELKKPFVTDLNCTPRPLLGAKVSHVIGPAGEQIEILCWHGCSPQAE